MRKFLIKQLINLIPFKKIRKNLRNKYLNEHVIFKSRYEIQHEKFNIGKNSYFSHIPYRLDPVIMSPQTIIGKYCSIAGEVCLGLGNHPIDRLSTHCFTYGQDPQKLYQEIVVPKENIIPHDATSPIIIGNDVWIGYRAIIMDGVTIGDGAIIGANAVVTKDIPPYAIAVGVPAKVVKYRFNQKIIKKLLELRWWDYPEEFIAKLPFDNIEKCIDILEDNEQLKDCNAVTVSVAQGGEYA